MPPNRRPPEAAAEGEIIREAPGGGESEKTRGCAAYIFFSASRTISSAVASFFTLPSASRTAFSAAGRG